MTFIYNYDIIGAENKTRRKKINFVLVLTFNYEYDIIDAEFEIKLAPMVELADTQDLKSCGRNTVSVRVRFGAFSLRLQT